MDYGGKVLDVIVSHPVYGSITTDLIMETRKDVYDFVKKVDSNKTVPLKKLTDDYHFHTVEADNEQILDIIEEQLRKKHYLVD